MFGLKKTAMPTADRTLPGRASAIPTAENHFIKTYNVRNKPLRFDVVTVILNTKGPATIRHYENVFSPGR